MILYKRGIPSTARLLFAWLRRTMDFRQSDGIPAITAAAAASRTLADRTTDTCKRKHVLSIVLSNLEE
jgi:hypothetical protein